MNTTRPERLRLAELTSGVGAVILGIGLGVLPSDRLAGSGFRILAAGIAVHGWGMYDRRRQERSQVPSIPGGPLPSTGPAGSACAGCSDGS